jgi:ATP-dependent DNA ligase
VVTNPALFQSNLNFQRSPENNVCRVASFLFSQYIARMLWRSSRGRPINAPSVFIHPCQPIVAKQPPSGPAWAHELKHDGYRLQIHVRDGRVSEKL